jgi:hypothetical protein
MALCIMSKCGEMCGEGERAKEEGGRRERFLGRGTVRHSQECGNNVGGVRLSQAGGRQPRVVNSHWVV